LHFPGRCGPLEAMSPAKKTAKKAARPMSDEHKAALAEGRSQSRAVRRYLEALDAHKPKRGRKRTPESIARRVEKIDAQLPDAAPLRQLELTQERMDLETELASLEAAADLSEFEADFIASAKGYSERKGISYAAWRAVGVTPTVLQQAGISRKG